MSLIAFCVGCHHVSESCDYKDLTIQTSAYVTSITIYNGIFQHSQLFLNHQLSLFFQQFEYVCDSSRHKTYLGS